MNDTFSTADLVDEHGAALRVCDTQFRQFGKLTSFTGPVRTISCFQDNGLVKQLLNAPGDGCVLVVDGGGDLTNAGHVSIEAGAHLAVTGDYVQEGDAFWDVSTWLRDGTLEASGGTVRLETGRTHQIRVHLSAIGHPVVGDPIYGSPQTRVRSPRTFLHARLLELAHPLSGKVLRVEAPLPADLQRVLESLEDGEGTPVSGRPR